MYKYIVQLVKFAVQEENTKDEEETNSTRGRRWNRVKIGRREQNEKIK
jgi:hypothetical protein